MCRTNFIKSDPFGGLLPGFQNSTLLERFLKDRKYPALS